MFSSNTTDDNFSQLHWLSDDLSSDDNDDGNVARKASVSRKKSDKGNSSRGGNINGTPSSQKPKILSIEDISKELFKLCDVATKRINGTKKKDIKTKLLSFFEMATLKGNAERQRACLQRQCKYSNGQGTLIHLLCDIPYSSSRETKRFYKEGECMIFVLRLQNIYMMSSRSFVFCFLADSP